MNYKYECNRFFYNLYFILLVYLDCENKTIDFYLCILYIDCYTFELASYALNDYAYVILSGILLNYFRNWTFYVI
jgi:hypothetical protein